MTIYKMEITYEADTEEEYDYVFQCLSNAGVTIIAESVVSDDIKFEED